MNIRIKFTIIVLIIIFMTVCISSAAEIHFTPSFSVSEEYTDNYFQTDNNTESEFSTEYLLGLDFEYIAQKGEVSLNYEVSYMDYHEYNDYDSWLHDLEVIGLLNLTRHTELTVTELFSRSMDISQRTGGWVEHDTNEITIALENQFAQRNSVGVDCSYLFDKFEDPDLDEYKTIRPSAFLNYWFNARYGFELSAYYENTDFDISSNKQNTWSGSIRFIRQMTNHFQAFVEYEHLESEDDFEEHSLYNPSVGFEWTVSETSNISMGAGVLIHRYENQEDSEDFFVDLDAFKLFNLSRRATFSISALSGYGEVSEDAASLGFRIYYEAGFNYNYELTKQAALDITGSYRRDEFNEEVVDRNDNTLDLSAGVSWSPLNWMTFGLLYTYTNFNTDVNTRDDYIENRGMVTVTITTPYGSQQVRQENTREVIEARIFNR